jgi:cytochrome c5
MKKSIIAAAAGAALMVSGQAAMAADGKATYDGACFACHATGAAGAPMFGNKEAWGPRIAKGMDALYASALNGVPGTGMLAKGGRADLSDEAVKAGVDYMVNAAK